MAPAKEHRRRARPPGKKAGSNSATPTVVADLSIEALSWGGDGVGRAEGKVVFTPLTAPGDRAEVEIVADRRSYSRGRLLSLRREGPGRTQPPCPLFADCGGCQWQHVSYEGQLAAKSAILTHSLLRIAKIPLPTEVRLLPSPRVFGYRHRTRLHSGRGKGGHVLGFYRTGSHEIVPVDRCLLLHDSLNDVLRAIGEVLEKRPSFGPAFDTVSLAADFAGARVRAAFRDGRGRAVIPPEAAVREISLLSGRAGVDFSLSGPGEKPLALGPGADGLFSTGDTFTQVNLHHNRNLVGEVVSMAVPAPGEKILDLYCGIGNFSFPLAATGSTVLGIDAAGSCIRCARENAEHLASPSPVFRRGGAESAVVTLAAQGERFDLVVLNPPRTGARDTVAELPALGPSRIVMVSCDPATFARDAATLAGGGYRLTDLRALDLFPQTFHFETVGLFTR
jgi:23S rRNA (uracil1939-C5)-methyltransferase